MTMTVEAIRVVGRLRRAIAAQAADNVTDGTLLERFVQQRDQAAFEDLVRRHGPMVLGVCRRILGRRPDVDDAFQAIFLVLVQKASSIVPRDMVGNWLHGVAYRTAVRVRGSSLLRQHREKPMVTIPEPATEQHGWDDLRPVLDEELGRLPARYRSVLVLCDMEGRTRKDAARHLRCPEGTVSTWLSRGRALLAGRLARRGIVLGGSTLATLLSEHATACVTPTLVDSTTRCASIMLTGTAAVDVSSRSTAAIPHGVSSIANGMVRTMAMNKAVVCVGYAIAAIVGSAMCGVIACGLQAGQRSTTPGSVASKPQEPATIEALVAQLGSDRFIEREAAEKALKEMGGQAYPAVKAGLKSKVPEIVTRCERLLPDLRVAGLAAPDHPLWVHYQKVIGKTADDRKLFLEAVSDKRRAEYFEAVGDNPEVAGAMYQRELDGALRHLSEKYEEARERTKHMTGLTHPSVGTPDHGGMAALLFLGTFPATAKITPKFEHPWLHGHYSNLMTMPRDSTVFDAEKRLYAAWLATRREPDAIRMGLLRATQFEIREAILTARALVADEKLPISDRVTALFVVMLSGDKADAALCAPFFKDESVYHETRYTDKDQKATAVITQVRDVAVAVALILHGEEPAEYDYDMMVLYKGKGLDLMKKYQFFCGFRTEAGRMAMHDKAQAFFAKVVKGK
jgi:RNA polymerase sigma factor (sigma-70 family)